MAADARPEPTSPRFIPIRLAPGRGRRDSARSPRFSLHPCCGKLRFMRSLPSHIECGRNPRLNMSQATLFDRIPACPAANSSSNSGATTVLARPFAIRPGTATVRKGCKSFPDSGKRRISEAALSAWTRAESRFTREIRPDSQPERKRFQIAVFNEGFPTNRVLHPRSWKGQRNSIAIAGRTR